MRDVIKSLFNFICLVLVSPLAVPVWLTAHWDKQDKFFQFASQLMCIFPGIPGDYLRMAFYRWVLDCIPPGPVVSFGTIFAQRDISIGRNVYIGPFCNIGSAAIADDVLIGSNVMIASPRIHSFDRSDLPIRQQGGEIEKIGIGDGAWLGNGSIVLRDIGSGCVIGAGAVVVKACEPNGIYVGNPAKLLRLRVEPE